MDVNILKSEIINGSDPYYKFSTGKDHIENFKDIVNIIKKHNLDGIKVMLWDEETMSHWIVLPDSSMITILDNET